MVLGAPPRLIAEGYRRLRPDHRVYVLRWLRNGILLGIAAAALLYLLVVIQASSDIGTAIRTRQAVTKTGAAMTVVMNAKNPLASAFENEDVPLTETGSDYISDITVVDGDLAIVAGDNGAGAAGTRDILFAEGNLDDYLQESESAASDAELPGPLSVAAGTYVLTGQKDLETALNDLSGTEEAALRGQRDEWPIDPAAFWWALLGPVIVVLILAAATACLVARRFRRHVSSPWLWGWLSGSLMTAMTTAVTAGFLNLDDELTLNPDPLAGHPVTLACATLLFLAAAVMAHLAYRRVLADYRLGSS
jgi:hypothetical protein